MHVILNKRGVSLYHVQEEPGVEVRESKNWALSSRGRLQLAASAGLQLTISLLASVTDEVLTSFPVPEGSEDSVVERAADSTGAFLLRPPGRAQIGIAFDERLDALDFFATVSGFHKQAPGAEAAAGKLRAVLGPHASDEELWPQLWRFRLDVRRAANGFLREVCAVDGTVFNFQPRLAPRELPTELLLDEANLVSWQELHSPLFPPSRHLGLRDLCSTLSCSRSMQRRVAQDDALWGERFDGSFGRAVPQAAEDEAHGGFMARFAARWLMEQTRSCPECRARAAIVPLLYGFPSPALVSHHQSGHLVLRELCGFLGPPWACKFCGVEWDEYPYASPPLRSRSRSARRSLLPRIPDDPGLQEDEMQEEDDE